MDRVEDAVAALAAGRTIIVVDDEDRENEGDFILPASTVTAEQLGFVVRHSSGVLCVPMAGERLDRLGLPPMTFHNTDPRQTAFAVTVDARTGVSTGISAADRARTIRLLASEGVGRGDLVSPGHVFPLRYRPGGVLVRPGHTEATIDLLRLAGMPEIGVLVEIVNDDGTMKRAPQLREFADEHGLVMISIRDLVAHRWRQDRLVERVVTTPLPTVHGDFLAHGYRLLDGAGTSEPMALVHGDIGDGTAVLTRVHSECLTGDVLGSLRCDCGPQLAAALDEIHHAGRGVLVYLRGHEGRGIGLAAKLRAYGLQDAGLDTVDANTELGLPADARHYGVAAQVLRDLGVTSVRLLTNNPAKAVDLVEHGVAVVEQVPLVTPANPYNERYLRTKQERMGHLLGVPGRSGA